MQKEDPVSLSRPDPKGFQHIPVQQGSCVICRWPIWPSETVAAVIGDQNASSTEFSAYTFGFPFPKPDHEAAFPTVFYQRHRQSRVWKACRYPTCTYCTCDVSLYHVDCYHMAPRLGLGLRLTLRDLWGLRLWHCPLPTRRYQAKPRRWSSLWKDPIVDEDPLTSSMRRLPPELRDMIFSYCDDSFLLRLFWAANRFRSFSPLLDGKATEKELSLPSLKSWNRGERLAEGRPVDRSGLIEIVLDDLGVKSLSFASLGSVSLSAKPSRGIWYMVEKLEDLRDVRVFLKGGFLRIENPKLFKLLDNPSVYRSLSNSEAEVRWTEHTEPVRIRSASLEGCKGITVYCCRGGPFWFRSHTERNEQASGLDEDMDMLASLEKLRYTAIYFPLADGEEIKGLWWRYHYHVSPPSSALVVSTNYGRSRVFGLVGFDDRFQQERRLPPLCNGRPRQILFADLDFRYFRAPLCNFGTSFTNRLDEDERASFLAMKQSGHSNWPRKFRNDGPLYVTCASLRNVTRVRLLHRRSEEETQVLYCIGMILEYGDGGLEALGAAGGTLVTEVVESPTGILWLKRSPGPEGGSVVRCLSAREDYGFLDPTKWRRRPMSGSLSWLFNYQGRAFIHWRGDKDLAES